MIEEPSQVLRENDTCPICLSVLYKPISLKNCKHVFCAPCINQATDFYQHKKCPLCRTDFNQQHKIALQQRQKQIEKLYPQLLKSRIANITTHKIYRVQIGNRTEVIQTQQNNKYRWTLYMQPAPGQKQLSQYVDKVQVKLHPTFHPNKIEFKGNQKIEIKRVGWGTFRIQLKIFWRKEHGKGFAELYHDLSFSPHTFKIANCKVGMTV